MPAWNGGRPGVAGVASSARVSRSTANGSPSAGMPTSSRPIHVAWPSVSVSVAAERTPMKE